MERAASSCHTARRTGAAPVVPKAVRLNRCLALTALALLGWAGLAQAQSEAAGLEAGTAVVIDVQGPIGPATRDFVTRSIDTAARHDAAVLVIRLDTPGGLDASTRDIIKAILDSPVPVATFVTPQGARAASAGTYILYASHIAAMAPATHVGAATPVALIGGGPSEHPQGAAKEEGEAAPETSGDTMMRKALSDSVAYIRSLAKLRGRNEDWAERAVRNADSITSEEALDLGVIDLVARDLDDLLARIDGRTVEVKGQQVTLHTAGLAIERLQPDWRNELLAAITSPTIAYVLLLIGVYGLILEGYHPGAVLPGVVGAICLLLALYALQMLPVNYVGLGLILLGIILIVAETMVPSFGVLGIGGIIALVIGSIMLIDTDVPGMAVSRPLIGAIAALGGIGLLVILGFAIKARRRPVVSGREQLIGRQGVALESFDREGHVFIHSERWNARTETPVDQGQTVVVTGIDGLCLAVRPAPESSERD